MTRGGSGLQSRARCGHVSSRSATEGRCSWGRRVATVERMTIQRMEHVGIVADDLAARRRSSSSSDSSCRARGRSRAVGSSVVGLEGVRAEIAMVETPDGHGRLELTKFHAPSGRGAATGTRRRTPRASAMSHSQSPTSTPSSLACEPAARRGSSSSWGSRSAEGSGRPPTASPASVVVPGQDPLVTRGKIFVGTDAGSSDASQAVPLRDAFGSAPIHQPTMRARRRSLNATSYGKP